MYDTVNMWLSWLDVGKYHLPTLINCLSNQTEHQNRNYNSISGSLNNYKVGVYESGISLKGSLSKFANDSNMYTLTRSGAEQAIIKMSDDLHLPINKAIVSRVDLSTHFVMKRPASDYYPFLGDKRYFKRLQATKDTLYYNTKDRQLIFYNKLKEAVSNGTTIPEVYRDENLLRYEIRYKGRLNKQFNLPAVNASTLYDEIFYINLIDIWAKEYLNIHKVNRLTTNNMEKIKTPKDAENMIFGLLLNKAGQGVVENILSDLKASRVYSDPKYYSRLKAKLKYLANNSEISERSELIAELDNEIKTVKQYYR